jgi:hypothetical protein
MIDALQAPAMAPYFREELGCKPGIQITQERNAFKEWFESHFKELELPAEGITLNCFKEHLLPHLIPKMTEARARQAKIRNAVPSEIDPPPTPSVFSWSGCIPHLFGPTPAASDGASGGTPSVFSWSRCIPHLFGPTPATSGGASGGGKSKKTIPESPPRSKNSKNNKNNKHNKNSNNKKTK